jgi:uncharacterized protein (TIGR00290 family)
MERVVFSWSGGKESALALDEVVRRSELDVAGLLTTFAGDSDRSFTHGVRRSVMETQAACMGLDFRPVPIPADATGEAYADLMADVFAEYRADGVTRLVLGDIELEDPDDYRQEAMAETGFRSYCPLLGHGTADLVERFLDSAFEATVVCVDEGRLDRSFAGRTLDESFVADLPDDVDPCGERGEYHTLVTDGPVFDEPLRVEVGDVVTRPVGDTEYAYADLQVAGDGE